MSLAEIVIEYLECDDCPWFNDKYGFCRLTGCEDGSTCPGPGRLTLVPTELLSEPRLAGAFCARDIHPSEACLELSRAARRHLGLDKEERG